MSFNPNSLIYLCNVPIDSTQKNQIYFSTQEEQQNYFKSKLVKVLENYLTVRESLADGSIRSSLKVGMNIESLRVLGCNYMMYQNANHGTKFFYAFITEMVYINENTTKIIFETDVFQTWFFNVSLKRSYVVREHSETDNLFENLVPEQFNIQDYVYENAMVFDSLDAWGYLIASSNPLPDDAEEKGKVINGIYQGLYFYYYDTASEINDFITTMEEEHGNECIQSITLIPTFSSNMEDVGLIGASAKASSHTFDLLSDIANKSFGNFKPKNKKLYTSPFMNLVVTNHSGDEVAYNLEDFELRRNESGIPYFEFTMKGDISINPTITLYPLYYKGIAENYDCGLSISGFPQCSFNSDTFKLWLAKNQFGMNVDTIGNVGKIVGGLGVAAASVFGSGVTGGASLMGASGGLSVAMSGVNGILNTVNSVQQMDKEPNKSHGGAAKNNLLTAIKKNKFDFYFRTIKEHYAQTIDDFFTLYGYQTNKLKVPNIKSRPYYNYVQTIDVNIVGGIPNDDMERLKAIYNNGVTIWKHTATIGDYSVDNSPQ